MGNLIKAIPLLTLALLIDGFQFLVSLALSLVAAFPGPTGGCALGAKLAGGIGCAVLGVVGSIPIINGALATITEPLGIMLGVAISICISFTLGSSLVLFLQLFGMLDKKAAVLTYMGEVLPGFDTLPAWTGLVVRCVYKKTKDELVTGIVGSITTIGSTLVLPNTSVGNAMQTRTLKDRETIVRSQPRYERLDSGESEAAVPQARSANLPMQDVRLRPSAPVSYAKAI